MIELTSVAMTDQLAEIIGKVAHPGDNLVLTGDLGAGKTTLTKGIAKGLGIVQMIKSPDLYDHSGIYTREKCLCTIWISIVSLLAVLI